MAVVAFLNGGDLFGAGNANAVLARNIGTFGAKLQLANTRTIAFTPTAGTMKGVVLAFDWSGGAATNVTAKLQFFNGAAWVDVAGTSKTLTATDITRGLVNLLPAGSTSGQFDAWFEFPTPAVVTAVAGVWRIDVTASGGNPFLWTSDGTNFFFVAVSTATTTFVTNQDQPVITNSQPVTYSSSVRFLGILPTGSTTRSVCGFLGSSSSGNGTAASMLKSTANGITTTLNGYFLCGSWSAFQLGTAATPLTNHTLNYDTATFGTARFTGFTTYRADADGSSNLTKMGFFLFGALPAVEDTYLTKDATVGATSCEVAHNTGWAASDRIYIGGQTTRGIGDTTAYTVSSTSGNTINFSPALAGSTRLAGVTATISIASPAVVTTTRDHGLFAGDEIYFRTTGALPTGITAGTKYFVISAPTTKTFTFSATLGGSVVNTSGSQSGTHTLAIAKYAGRVIRMNGYGIIWQTNVSGGVAMFMGQPSNNDIRGCQIRDIYLVHSTNGGRENDYLPYISAYNYSNCSFESTTNPTAGHTAFLGQFVLNQVGAVCSHVNIARAQLYGALTQTAGNAFAVNISDCINIILGFTSGGGYSVGTSVIQLTMERNHFESANVQMTFQFSASTFNNNRFWGCSTAIGWFRINTGIDGSFYRNIFDNSVNGYSFVSTTVGCKGVEDIFGPVIANTADMNFLAGYTQFEEENSPTAFVVDSGANSPANTVVGSILRIAGYGGNSNDNRTESKFGKTQSCGTGLADTLVRTAGGYSIRLEPNSGTNVLAFPLPVGQRVVPTGNIQNKTMTLSIWCYIANSAYAAGTHIKPTLNVKYDNATTVSAVATATYGSWQLLAVTFTPLTTFGQIEWWITGATDAAGANRYFYLDDIAINYPAGVNLDLGNMDLWAAAYPVLPPIATNPSLGGVWDEPIAAHNIAGSYGEEVNNIKNETGLIGALL